MTILFDEQQVTLTGVVPDDDAVNRLTDFAADYRLTPAPVVNELSIDSNAPSTGGVRIVELNSINFVDDLDEISSEHAQQIERVLVTMAAFPNATVHVVGNSDAQGDDVGNLAVSQRRAEAVVDYLVSNGVAPERLSTQPAGATNPLRTDATPEADAINRRTEFVFFGFSTAEAVE